MIIDFMKGASWCSFSFLYFPLLFASSHLIRVAPPLRNLELSQLAVMSRHVTSINYTMIAHGSTRKNIVVGKLVI